MSKSSIGTPKSTEARDVVGKCRGTGHYTTRSMLYDRNVRLAIAIVSGNQPIHIRIRIITYLSPNWGKKVEKGNGCVFARV
jgi:hypothetical protein